MQTRPDVVWIVKKQSRFKHKPTNSHWLAGKCVPCILQATKSLKLEYPIDSDFKLTGQNDADWIVNHDDRHLRHWLIHQTQVQWRSGGLANEEAKESGSLRLGSKAPEFGCSSSRNIFLEITILWIGLSTDVGNGHWSRPSELQPTGDQTTEAQTIRAYLHETPLHLWKSQRYFSSASVHANRSTSSQSVDVSTYSRENWAKSTSTVGKIADFSHDWQKNLIGGVEEKNVEFLEPQNFNFSPIIAQNRAESN